MKNRKYKFCITLVMSAVLMLSVLCVGVSAMNAGNNIISRHGDIMNGTAPAGRSTADTTSDGGNMTDDTFEGNIDSGTDGHIDDNSGTGEFGDDTSNISSTASDDTTAGPVESMIDGVMTDAADAIDDTANAVEDATDGNMWGIIIAIIIIAAIAALLFAFFVRKK